MLHTTEGLPDFKSTGGLGLFFLLFRSLQKGLDCVVI